MKLGRSKMKKTPSPNEVGGYHGEEREEEGCEKPYR